MKKSLVVYISRGWRARCYCKLTDFLFNCVQWVNFLNYKIELAEVF